MQHDETPPELSNSDDSSIILGDLPSRVNSGESERVGSSFETMVPPLGRPRG